MKRERRFRLRFFLLASLCWLTMSGRALAKNAQQESAKFFAQTNILTFNIDIAEPEFTALRNQSRTYVRATIRAGDEVFKDVAVRLKGWGTFRPLTGKPSFSVKFNGFVQGQRFHGLSKLMLNNSAQDATCLCELLSGGLFLDAGLPAARVTHARVRLNNRDLGFYVLIEAMNEHFLKRNFKNSTGNLYEGPSRMSTERWTATTDQTAIRPMCGHSLPRRTCRSRRIDSRRSKRCWMSIDSLPSWPSN